jgi:hypothetical protein
MAVHGLGNWWVLNGKQCRYTIRDYLLEKTLGIGCEIRRIKVKLMMWMMIDCKVKSFLEEKLTTN